MKRILYGISFIILSILCINRVMAASFNFSLTGNTNFENQITLKVKVGDLVGFDTGIYGMTGYLEYDSTKLELSEIDSVNDFELGYGDKSKKIVLFKEEGVNTGTEILELVFKNIRLNNGEETTVKINKIKVSDGDKDLGDGSYTISKKIKLVLPNQSSSDSSSSESSSESKPSSSSSESSKPASSSSGGSESSSGEASSSSSKQEEKKSNNNYLSTIVLSAGSINFSKDKLIYDILVGYDVDKINVNAKASDNKAKITGIDIYDLEVGINKIALVVTAEDKTTRTYLLNITREKEDVTVNGDELDEGVENDEVVVPDKDDNTITTGDGENKKNGFILPVIIGGVVLLGAIAFVVIKNKK